MQLSIVKIQIDSEELYPFLTVELSPNAEGWYYEVDENLWLLLKRFIEIEKAAREEVDRICKGLHADVYERSRWVGNVEEEQKNDS